MSKIANVLSILAAIPELLHFVSQTVQEVELVSAGIPGAQKFAAAEAMINAFLATATEDVAAVAQVSGVLKPLIDSLVAMFNSLGMFHKAA